MYFCLQKNSLLSLEGPAALDFGQRLFSRNIQKLQTDAGCLSLFLSADGKVSEVFWVIRKETGLLLIVPQNRLESLKGLIERYHFAEAFQTLESGEMASSWSPADLKEPHDGEGILKDGVFKGSWRSTEFRFEFEKSVAATEVDLEKWELHRITNLIPEWEKDFDNSSLVFDLGFEELCDPAKGCYIGQEVVERVRTRGGHFPRRLALLHWKEAPEPNEIVYSHSGQAIGSVTKSAIKVGTGFQSLGFIKRNSATAGDKISMKDGGLLGEIIKIYP